MKTTHFSLILLPILVFFLANGLSTPQATVALPVVPSDSVDHFKIWDVDVQSANVPVNLKDQFYPEGRDGVVDSLTKFANPVRKIHEDTFHIIDPNAHLAIYNVTVEEDSLPLDIRVRIETQFDREEWLLGKARFLLVPTHKVEKGSSFPTNLDHYLCYEVIGTPDALIEEFELEDQYDVRRDTVERIDSLIGKYFCLPVDKNNEGIQNDSCHLAWYQTFPTDTYMTSDSIFNQFGGANIFVYKNSGLLVPAIKLAWRFEM